MWCGRENRAEARAQGVEMLNKQHRYGTVTLTTIKFVKRGIKAGFCLGIKNSSSIQRLLLSSTTRARPGETHLARTVPSHLVDQTFHSSTIIMSDLIGSALTLAQRSVVETMQVVLRAQPGNRLVLTSVQLRLVITAYRTLTNAYRARIRQLPQLQQRQSTKLGEKALRRSNCRHCHRVPRICFPVYPTSLSAEQTLE